MNFAISKEDVDNLRAYVTAKDGHEYDDVDAGIVCFDITHNYLKVRMHGVRMPVSSSVFISSMVDVKILDLKRKVAIHSGTPVEFQRLELRGADGSFVAISSVCAFQRYALTNDNATLESYGFKNGMEVHCIDFVVELGSSNLQNPDSLAKDGGLDDETKIEKKIMTDEEYNKRENTVRSQRLQLEAQRIAEGVGLGAMCDCLEDC